MLSLRRIFKRNQAPSSVVHLLAPGGTVAGEVVTQQTIEWLPAAQRAISLIAGDIARLPMRLIRRDETGGRVEQGGPTAQLLTRQPTQSLHSFAWRRHIVREYLIHGNAICYIQKSNADSVLQLLPLEAGSVRIEYRGAEPMYIHKELGELAPSEVLHFRQPGGSTGLWGDGLLNVGREALAQLRSQQRVAASVAANTVQPRVVLKHPGKLSEQMALAAKAKFQSTFSGAGSGGVVLLQDGMGVETLSVKMTDLDFLATCNWSIGEVSRLTGVPVSMLSEHSHSTFSNVSELNRSYLDQCLAVDLAMITAEIENKLLRNREVEFDTTALTKGSLADQVNAWSLAVDRGVITRNEMRTRLGLNPIEGLDTPVLRLDTAEMDEDEDEDETEIEFDD